MAIQMDLGKLLKKITSYLMKSMSSTSSSTTIDIDTLHGSPLFAKVWCNATYTTGTLPWASGYYHVYVLGSVQLAFQYNGDGFKFRTYTNSQWYEWKDLSSLFVSKSGDTMSGDLVVSESRTGSPSPAIKVENAATGRRMGAAIFSSYSSSTRNTGLYQYDIDTGENYDIITKRFGADTKARIPSWASTGSATQPVYINSNGEAVACTGVQTAAVTPNSTHASLSGSYSRLKIVGNMAFLSISLSLQAISAQAEYIEVATIPSADAPSTDWYFTALERNTEKAHFMVITASGSIRIYPRSAAIASGAILRGSTSWVIGN